MGTPEDLLAAEDGCYEAARAAALSGVPLSTVYDWARSELVVPSVSPAREMLWSYADLMTGWSGLITYVSDEELTTPVLG